MKIKIIFYGTGADDEYLKYCNKNAENVCNDNIFMSNTEGGGRLYEIVGCNILGIGKRSVEGLFKEARNFFETELSQIEDNSIEIDIRGRSRGGVSAQKLFEYLNGKKKQAKNLGSEPKNDSTLVSWMSGKEISIKLTTGDAYYGPTARGKNKKVDLKEGSLEDNNSSEQKLNIDNEKNTTNYSPISNATTAEGTPSSDNSSNHPKEEKNSERKFDTLIVLSTNTRFNCTPMMIRNADKIIVTTEGHNAAGDIAEDYDLNKEQSDLINNGSCNVFLDTKDEFTPISDQNDLGILFDAVGKSTYKPRRNVIMLLVCEKLKIKPEYLIKNIDEYKNEFNRILEKIKNSKNVKGVFKNALSLFDSPNHIFYHIIHRKEMSRVTGGKTVGKFYSALTKAKDTCLKSKNTAEGKKILEAYEGKHTYKKDLIKAILDKLNEFESMKKGKNLKSKKSN